MPYCKFFATAADLAPGFEELESKYDLVYYGDSNDAPGFVTYRSVFEIPDFGYEYHYDFIAGRRFLILSVNDDVVVDSVLMANGRMGYSLLREDNPRAMRLHLGGVLKPKYLRGMPPPRDACIMGGELGCEATGENVEPVYKQFPRIVTKGFIEVKDRGGWRWKIGPEAVARYRRGYRLVCGSAIETPRSGDVTVPE